MTATATEPVRPPRKRPDLVVAVSPEDSRRHLFEAIDRLRVTNPELCAHEVVTRLQVRAVSAVALVLVVLVALFPLTTMRVMLGLVTFLYAAVVAYRALCFRRGSRGRMMVRVSDEAARAFPDRDLPRYTVLVPAYREPEVIRELLREINALEYPRRKLEVLVLLEEDDLDTMAAVRRCRPGRHVRVVVVPPSQPQTKPKACNYGLQLATGALVTIYDAEDRPDPLQLRRAAIAFRALPDDVVCLQALLGYYNPGQNRITQWFTAEYLTWFAHFLPGLVSLGAPVPLGGTSNHMRVDALRELGAWDPYNVTEDADLGMRLHRAGLRTMVLDSVTLEEANSDFVNWVKQRSRWYKGYLQTWLVHMRHPVQTKRQMGWRGLVGLNLFVGGTPMLALLNPVFWTLTLIWFVAHPQWLLDLFPGPIYYPAMICWIFGNLLVLYLGVLSTRLARRPDLLWASLLSPLYWVMMAVAAAKAALQLVQMPSFWEKTTHGLGDAPAQVRAR